MGSEIVTDDMPTDSLWISHSFRKGKHAMTVKIISTYDAPMTSYNLGYFAIDLTRKTAVLIRQSYEESRQSPL